MLEAMLKIGRPDRWWNRNVSIVRIGVIAVAVVCGFFVWAIYGDLIGSVAWGVRHQRTASFRGQTLQVPWFWREEKWANYNEFTLSRSYSGLVLSPSVTVRYENSAPDDVQRRVNNFSKFYAQTSQQPDSYFGDYEGGDFTKAHYVCLENGARHTEVIFVDCFSRDGRWVVSMFGLQRSRSEFEMILRGVVAMGNQSK
jgi:hypothetical protein